MYSNLCIVIEMKILYIKYLIFLEDLKQLIWVQTNVPPCQQRLYGWKKEPKSDYRSLQSLDLPKENTLYMSSATEDADLTTDM